MRILREPLFHFFLLGLAIFGWFSLKNPDTPVAEGVIVIDDKDVTLLTEQFAATWRRPPTPAELEGLVQTMLREEVLVREAEALGLDQGDSVIRSRLVQKMTFLTESVAQAMTPEDSVLIEHMQAYPDQFRRPGRVAFEQVGLGPSPTDAEIAELRAALEAGADPATLGLRSLLPPALPLSTVNSIDGVFGRGMFDGVYALEGEGWQGPVQSGYGWHLVRVTEKLPEALPPFEEAREAVLAHWRRETSETLSNAQFESLKAQYEVTLPETGESSGEAAQ